MISIVIPSYNSGRTINACLSSLLAQSYEGEKEIILVDSSVDNTPEIVETYFPEIKFIHFDRKTDPGTARNKGVEVSSGEIILFIDSDCVASPGWIEKMVNTHQRYPEAEAVGGSVTNGNIGSDVIGMAGYMAEFREFIPQAKSGYVDHVPTLNISYKRRVFEKYGHFNPDFYPQEDLLFNYHLTAVGGKIFFEPAIQVQHLHRSSFKAFIAHQKRIGTITATVMKTANLSGAKLMRNRLYFTLIGPLLPFVKFIRTLGVFLQKDSRFILKNIRSVAIFKIGLFFWFLGLCRGVFRQEEQH